MNTEFENHLKRLMNERVDVVLGELRPAPAWTADKRRRGRRARWTFPLLAAACVAIVADGTVGATTLLADHRHVTPATPVPPSRPVLTPTPIPSPSTTATPSAGGSRTPSSAGERTSSPPPAALKPTVVEVAGASLGLPAGWRVTANPSSDAKAVGENWCLGPTVAAGHAAICPITFDAISTEDGEVIDVDHPGVYQGLFNCYGSGATQEQYDNRTLGGRMAAWRRFDFTCSSMTWHVEQYAVVTVPGFLLQAGDVDASVHTELAYIAAHSTLPRQSRSLPLSDYGYVRSAETVSGGQRIELEQVTYVDAARRVSTGRLVQYVVPTTALTQPGPLKVGDLLLLGTNGTVVAQCNVLRG